LSIRILFWHIGCSEFYDGGQMKNKTERRLLMIMLCAVALSFLRAVTTIQIVTTTATAQTNYKTVT